jgi:hypothetical protein
MPIKNKEIMFFETKIKRFEVDKRIDPVSVKEDFDLVDGYKEHILQYMYTNIPVRTEADWNVAFQNRVQVFLSQSLLRSLFLKDAIIEALNSNNFPAFYALTKSFLEISAQLGYLTYLLYENKPDEELKEKLHQMTFAHKGGLSAEIGVEPINVLTMFDKLDIVMQKIDLSQTTDAEEIKRIKANKAMRTIYEDICNFGHPNFASHLSVGKMNNAGYWTAKDPKKLESYKYELYGGFYMHHLTIAIGTIYIAASMIERHPKIDRFGKLNNPHLEI